MLAAVKTDNVGVFFLRLLHGNPFFLERFAVISVELLVPRVPEWFLKHVDLLSRLQHKQTPKSIPNLQNNVIG